MASKEYWSDLIDLTYVLDESPDETYVQELARVVNVDQWLRWFALMTLLSFKGTFYIKDISIELLD